MFCAHSSSQFDIKNRRTFLKRCDYPGIRVSDLYKGNIITVYSRQLTIVDYADKFTAQTFEKKTEMCATLAVTCASSCDGNVLPETHILCPPSPSLPPIAASRTVAYLTADAIPLIGKALDLASAVPLGIVELRMLSLSPSEASAIFSDSSFAAAASKGPLIAAKLAGEDAVAKWGAAIRGQTGVSGSASGEAALKEAEALFGGRMMLTAAPEEFESSSLLLVRPHAVRDGKLGAILHQVIESGFSLRALSMVQLSRPNAVEFMEVYKGVVPEYTEWVEEIVGGKCVAVQVVYSPQPEKSVVALRELCGAHDPEVAGHLHKGSLRALYGEDKVKNAVHCTDLPDDSPLELDYFFCLLPSAA